MGEEIESVWSRRHLMARYAKSRMTIWRWENAGHLPKPDMVIAGKPAWYPSTILEFERQSARVSA
jgi:predicted DNA-binding transcriptional regulator AlpA